MSLDSFYLKMNHLYVHARISDPQFKLKFRDDLFRRGDSGWKSSVDQGCGDVNESRRCVFASFQLRPTQLSLAVDFDISVEETSGIGFICPWEDRLDLRAGNHFRGGTVGKRHPSRGALIVNHFHTPAPTFTRPRIHT